MQRILRLTSFLCALLALAASPAFAQQFVVFSARHEAANGQVVLVGSGFRSDMRILLNGAPLANVTVKSSEMRAKLPALEPGTYRLVIDPKRGQAQRFMVTVNPPATGGTGVPGPMGPMGPQGPAGLLGPQGPAGVAGPAGAAGPSGPQGVQGPQGPQGSSGATGAAGAVGPMGPAGVAGPAGAMGPSGPQGAQGPQGPQGPAGVSAGVVVAGNGATLGTVLSFQPGSATLVALQHEGVWLVAPVTTQGIQPTSLLALYADEACATPPFVPLDTDPAPFYRLLQIVSAGDPIGYYAGNPTESRASLGISPLGRPDQCRPAAGTGWDAPMLAGPLRTIRLEGFPAPFSIRP